MALGSLEPISDRSDSGKSDTFIRIYLQPLLREAQGYSKTHMIIVPLSYFLLFWFQN